MNRIKHYYISEGKEECPQCTKELNELNENVMNEKCQHGILLESTCIQCTREEFEQPVRGDEKKHDNGKRCGIFYLSNRLQRLSMC